MKRYILSEPAIADLRVIWKYIAIDSERAADEVLDNLLSKCQKLADLPMMGRARPDLRKDIRYFPVERYLIFYHILEDQNI